MGKILLLAQKELKRKFLISVAVSVLFGGVSGAVSASFYESSALLSFGTSLLILNVALFLLGADAISGERAKGTLSFLLTLPLRDIEIVLGKLLGLMLLILPSILINTLLISLRFSPDFSYFTSLFLYFLFSSSLLLFSSAQFQRLPAIFLAFVFYNFVLAMPGALWLSQVVVTREPAPIFPVFLLIFSFFTPVLFGISEYLSSKMPLLLSQVTSAPGPGAMFVILESSARDLNFALVNLFSPLWGSSLYLLRGSEHFEVFNLAGVLAILSALSTAGALAVLSSLQLRGGKLKVFCLFLTLALLPALLGLPAPPGKIDLPAKTFEAPSEPAEAQVLKPAGVKYRADERICELQKRAEEAFLRGDINETLRILKEHRKLAEENNFTEAVKLIDEITRALEEGDNARIYVLGPRLSSIYEGCSF